MGKLDDRFFGNIPPDETVKLVFNLSQGEDKRGPWNEEPDFDYVEIRSRMAECPLPQSMRMTKGQGERSGEAAAQI